MIIVGFMATAGCVALTGLATYLILVGMGPNSIDRGRALTAMWALITCEFPLSAAIFTGVVVRHQASRWLVVIFVGFLLLPTYLIFLGLIGLLQMS